MRWARGYDPRVTGPTPPDGAGTPSPGGATRAPLVEGEEPEATPLERAKRGWDLVSDLFSPLNVLALIGLLIIGVIGLVGGWGEATASAKDVPVVQPDQPITAAPFEITVQRARTASEFKPIALKDPEFRYLFLVVKVTSSSEIPVPAYVLSKAIKVDAAGLQTGRKASGESYVMTPEVYRMIDSLRATTLQPGLTYDLVLSWKQRQSEPVPTTLSVAVASQTYDEHNAQQLDVWGYDTQVAIVHVDATPLQGP